MRELRNLRYWLGVIACFVTIAIPAQDLPLVVVNPTINSNLFPSKSVLGAISAIPVLLFL